jgi:3-isopropylmalate/(R)-2-methylmalate dehydratase large subunit
LVEGDAVASGTLLQQVLRHKGGDEGASEVALAVDHVFGHDRNTFKIVHEYDALGDPPADEDAIGRWRLFLDHYAPPPTVETAALHGQQRELAREHGLFLSPVGGGVGHQVAAEQLVSPFEVVVGVDSHTCTAGGLGALGLRQPPVAVARALREGAVRFDVPRSVRIETTGVLRRGCCAMDAMFTLAPLGAERFEDVILEFGGPGIAALSIAERLVLANLSVDIHARSALVETDARTARYLTERGRGDLYQPLSAARDAYTDVVELDLSRVRPMVAPPPRPTTAVPVADLSDAPRIDVATIGSCTGGRVSDFADFLDALGPDGPAPGVRIVATPASREVYRELLRQGLIERLLSVGATVNPPGCGPCMGLHQGVLVGDEVCVATGSRNGPGRMGSTEAQVFLAGPLVAGASAAAGTIVEPTTHEGGSADDQR